MRLMLDNNVWAWIADAHETDALANLEEELAIELVVPPSILLEVLETPDDEVVVRLVRALTDRPRAHPLPEVRLEVDEVVAAMRHRRPEWLRQRPRTDRISTLENFWTRRLWIRTRSDPLAARDHRARVVERDDPDGRLLRGLIEFEKDQRRRLMDFNKRMASSPSELVGLQLTFDPAEADKTALLGWDGQPLDTWRIDGALFWWRELVVIPARRKRTGEDSSSWDWAGPYLKEAALRSDRESFNRLWYSDLSADDVPRCWIRTNARWAQAARKITSGNPWDESLCIHLPDVDLFATADRRLAEVVAALRKRAPVQLAECVLVTDQKAPVRQLRELLTTLPS